MNTIIKICDNVVELEQIYRLNHYTFTEEIPQHSKNDSELLVDKFDSTNTYIIAMKNETLIGMISINDRRPFSLDQKLNNLDTYLPPHKNICEIRLLSIKKEYRGGSMLFRLISFLKNYALEKGYDMAVISGTTRQLKLYENIGFQKFGPLLGSDGALFQPMYITTGTIHPLLTK